MFELRCPCCNNPEMHPSGKQVLIRAYKVDNWSQCLVCSGYYDQNLVETKNGHNPEKGWFK
jgi:hypothetical protein